MPVTLTSLNEACDGRPKTSGIASLFVIPTCDIDTWGSIADIDSAASIDKLGMVTTANVPVLTKGYIKMPIQLHKNSLKLASQGENGTGNNKSTFNGLIPGFSDLKVGTLNFLRYVALNAIVVMPDGESFQLGSKDLPAFLTYEGDTDTTDSSSAVGLSITVEAISTYINKYDKTLTITELA